MTEPQPQQVRQPPPPLPPAPPGTMGPQPGAPWGFGPPPPRKRSRWVVVAVVAGILFGGLMLIGIVGAAVDTSKAVKAAPQDQFDHGEDVQIVRCAPDEYGDATATVVITNHSSKASTYAVTVAFDATSGAQVGTGYAGADQLQPGQASTPQKANSTQPAPRGGFTCRVADATRFAAN